jgi:2-polyprenyl-3-methyl-5-hydroxy-6-metoxy-1,4-benzoquinol methylase
MPVSYELTICPACGASHNETVAGPAEIRAEVEQLWHFHLRRRSVQVPAEQLFDHAFFSQHPPLRLARCSGCGTLYRDPCESAHELRETYTLEQADAHVYAALLRAQQSTYRKQARRLTRVLGRAGNGLELGSYVGGFLAAARDSGWNMLGVDVNDSAIAFARGRGLAVRAGTLEDAPPGPFDAIAIWNCFDQVPEPRATLRAARARLHAGGVLALRVPNGACYARVRRIAIARSFLAWNNLLAFPYRQGFTPDSLRLLLEAEGYRVESLHGDTLVRTSDAWTRRWARWEEVLVETIGRATPAGLAPWFEVYARVGSATAG